MLQNGKMMNIGGKQRFKLELEKFISTRLRPVSGIPSVESGADQKKDGMTEKNDLQSCSVPGKREGTVRGLIISSRITMNSAMRCFGMHTTAVL